MGVEKDFVVVTMLQIMESLRGMTVAAAGFLELGVFGAHAGEALFMGAMDEGDDVGQTPADGDISGLAGVDLRKGGVMNPTTNRATALGMSTSGFRVKG